MYYPGIHVQYLSEHVCWGGGQEYAFNSTDNFGQELVCSYVNTCALTPRVI